MAAPIAAAASAGSHAFLSGHRVVAASDEGEDVGRRFQADRVTSLRATILGGPAVFFTWLSSEAHETRDACPGDPEAAYAVQILLRPLDRPELWHGRRRLDLAAADRGSAFVFDLEDAPFARFRSPFDNIRLHLRRSALDALADRGAFRRPRSLRSSEWGRVDPVLEGLSRTLLPAFARPQETNALFLDSVASAFVLHLVSHHSDRQPASPILRGGLSARHLKRTKELIESRLDGALSLEELADACGISAGHFSRAFRKATGLPPHRWLLTRRVARAQLLLQTTDLGLPEVASLCGFADQSHFTRVFARFAGRPPGIWRRER